MKGLVTRQEEQGNWASTVAWSLVLLHSFLFLIVLFFFFFLVCYSSGLSFG